MNKLAPIVFYCNGLGATTRSGIVLSAKNFIKYRNLNCQNYVWNVDDWLNDLLVNIDECSRQQRLCLLLYTSSYIIKATSYLWPNALSPGVGLNLKSYIHAVMPQLWEKILAEKSVHILPLNIGQQLWSIENTCVSNRMTSIPINCPVRIMHGSNDKIVPLLNVEKFKEKLESKDVILSVINNSGHYLPLGKEFEKLFDSLICSVQQIMR
ncbi:hypothetical protein DINM_000068 [Dirofilaria immitis]|nr:hypothetical protein [Dirofilaria immitis]